MSASQEGQEAGTGSPLPEMEGGQPEVSSREEGTEPALNRWIRAGFMIFMAALVLAMFPFTEDTTGPIKRLLLSWGAFALSAGYLAGTWLSGRPLRRSGPLFWILAVWLACHLLAALACQHVGHALFEVRRLAALFLLYWVAGQVFTSLTRARALLVAICLSASLSSLYALAQSQGADPFPWAYIHNALYAKLPGTLGNPNYASHALILCLLFAAYLAAHKSTRWAGWCIPLFLLHLFYAHHRGGLAALAAALLLLFSIFIARRVVKGLAARTVIAFVIPCLVAATATTALMAATYARTGSPVPFEESLYVRYNAYSGAARMIQENPLLGQGPGNYVIENPRFWTSFEQKRFADTHKMNAHVHNEYLEFGADAGLPGALLYLFLLMAGLCRGLHVAFMHPEREGRRWGLLVAAFFCAYATDGLFGFNAHVPVSAALLFLMAGLLDGTSDLTASQRETVPVPRRDAWFRWPALAVGLVIAVLDAQVFLAHMLRYAGTAALEDERFQTAERAFAMARHFAPWDWTSASLAGGAARGGPQAAIAFRQAVALNPSDFTSMIALAQIHLREAVSPVTVCADDPDATERRAKAIEYALHWACAAQALCPVLPEAAEMCGRIYFGWAQELQRAPMAGASAPTDQAVLWKKAADHLGNAIRFGSKSPAPLYTMLARICMAQGDSQAAEDDLVEALASRPGLDVAWACYLALAEQANRHAGLMETVEMARKGVSQGRVPDPRALATIDIWHAKALQALDHDAAGALRILENAVAEAPEDVAIRLALARNLAALGGREAAGNAFDAVLNSPALTDEQRAQLREERDRLGLDSGEEPTP